MMADSMYWSRHKVHRINNYRFPYTLPCRVVASVSHFKPPACLLAQKSDRHELTELPPSTLAQPIPFDSDGQMRIDLLGIQPGGLQLKVWKNVWNVTDSSGPLHEV